jgi:hypothetical protein
MLCQGSNIVWNIPRCALTVRLDVTTNFEVSDKQYEVISFNVSVHNLVVELVNKTKG